MAQTGTSALLLLLLLHVQPIPPALSLLHYVTTLLQIEYGLTL
jgi:hypothetical protein